jgi:hypothetical protein
VYRSEAASPGPSAAPSKFTDSSGELLSPDVDLLSILGAIFDAFKEFSPVLRSSMTSRHGAALCSALQRVDYGNA